MDLIGRLVANRALSERRNIVTEIIGAEVEPVHQFIDALRSVGYSVQARSSLATSKKPCGATNHAVATTSPPTTPSPSNAPGSSKCALSSRGQARARRKFSAAGTVVRRGRRAEDPQHRHIHFGCERFPDWPSVMVYLCPGA